MQDLNSSKITELEETVKEEFAAWIESAGNVIETVDKIHIFGLFGKNTGRFRFLPGHKTDIEKLADEVKKHSLDHYRMPTGYKVGRKNIVRTPIGFLYGGKTHTQNNVVSKNLPQINLMPSNSTPDDVTPSDSASNDIKCVVPSGNKENTKSAFLLRVNAMLQLFETSLTDDDISFVNDGSKLTAYVHCKICPTGSKEKSIVVQYEINSRKMQN